MNSINFIMVCNNFSEDVEVQADLLYKWVCNTRKAGSEFIPSANISFKRYKLLEYPDQAAARACVKQSYTNRQGKMYWAGEQYTDFDKLYTELSEEKELAELTISY